MITAGKVLQLNVRGRLARGYYISVIAFFGYVGAYLISKGVFGQGFGGFPEAVRVNVQQPVDEVFMWIGTNLSWLVDPIAVGIEGLLSGVEALLLWVPWMAVLAIAGMVAFRWGGVSTAMFAIIGLLLIGMWGLWDATMITLSLMSVSVFFAVSLGIPIGIAAAMNDRVERIIRPILDTMQVLPAFVYLMPALFLFGVGGPVSVFLTVVYAIPPVIRLTNLGLRRVPMQIIETAISHGSARFQTLFQVQIPLAKPTIMMGINQTIMMALAMVIITALVGSTGLGREVWNSLRRIDAGSGIEAGLAIVFIAILFDRLSYGFAKQGNAARLSWIDRKMATLLDRGFLGARANNIRRRLWFPAAACCAVVFLSILGLTAGFSDFPRAMHYSVAGAMNEIVDWAAVNIFFLTDWFKESVLREFGLSPVQATLSWLPWPFLVGGSAAICYAAAGWKVALFTASSALFFGITGVWELTLHTLSQVIVAVTLSVLIGFLLGILASQNRIIDGILRPIFDTMQTMPVFVYLIPVIMLWGSGPVTAVIATALYAIPPAARMTSLGIKLVPVEIIETAKAHGASPIQILFQIEIPLALRTIMTGVNQTIIMAFAMVIIGGLVGGGGLGQDIYVSSVYLRMGQGLVAGMSIVLLAMILDRVSNGNRRRDYEMIGVD